MARMLMAALQQAGHEVSLISALRAYTRDPAARPLDSLERDAEAERARLSAEWRADRAPDLLFTYHLYYKAPDLLGPRLANAFRLPYVTLEASLSTRRAEGPWAAHQASVAAAIRRANLNLCFTTRDRDGLADVAAPGTLAELPPFIDAAPLARSGPRRPGSPLRLITVAMMRPGDKLASYRFLAQALAVALADLPHDLPWRLDIIGDGLARPEVEEAMQVLPAGCVRWLGVVPSEAVAAYLWQADLFVWPGFNEAFGLCYLEAQAAGLPVVAVRNAGTPAVIQDGITGRLTAADPQAFGAATLALMQNSALRARLGRAASDFVQGERNLAMAAAQLDAFLHDASQGVRA